MEKGQTVVKAGKSRCSRADSPEHTLLGREDRQNSRGACLRRLQPGKIVCSPAKSGAADLREVFARSAQRLEHLRSM
jgi:hypothetical protein